MSIEQEDAAVAKVTTHPRVTLADIEANIIERYDVNAWDGVAATIGIAGPSQPSWWKQHPLQGLSLCILVLKNGFTIVGTSAPASPENFDAEIGRKIAYENALRQVWPLMGYELRQRLSADDADDDGR